MISEKKLTCIICPVGCALTVSGDRENVKVSGNECARGEQYARSEYPDPRRTLTGTILVKGAFLQRLPVKSDRPLPRSLLLEAAGELNRIFVTAPVKSGAVLVENLLGSGANLLATRDLEKI